MGTNPTSVLSAKAKESELADEKLIDLGMTTTLAFPNNTDATGTIICDFEGPKWGPFGLLPAFPDMRVKVTCENGEIEMFNFVMPFLYHWIRVQPTGKKERIEKVYKPTDVIGGEGAGEDWWTTYRYQLEAFVDRAKGRTPQSWMNKEESIENILWIEEIYKKASYELYALDVLIDIAADWPRTEAQIDICTLGIVVQLIKYLSGVF